MKEVRSDSNAGEVIELVGVRGDEDTQEGSGDMSMQDDMSIQDDIHMQEGVMAHDDTGVCDRKER